MAITEGSSIPAATSGEYRRRFLKQPKKPLTEPLSDKGKKRGLCLRLFRRKEG